jgi:integrase
MVRQRRQRGTGGVYRRRSDGRWVAAVDLGPDPATGKRRRKVLYGRTRQQAQDKARAATAQLAAGTLALEGAPTLATWLDYYLGTVVVQRGLKRSTIAGYRSKVKFWPPPLLRKRIDQISPRDVRAFIATETGRGQSPSSIQQSLGILQGALRVAQAEERVTRNVAALVDKPPRKKVRRSEAALSVEEARQVLDAARGDRLEARWWCAFLGLRRGEALGLRWDHEVDLANRLLTVEHTILRVHGQGIVEDTPKSSSSRRWLPLWPFIAPFNRRWVAWLEERQAAEDRWHDTGLVFCTPIGTPLDPPSDWKAWKALLTRAGVRYVRPHDARHTAASLLLEAGIPMKVVQEWLGHSTIVLTADLYSHVAPELMTGAAEALGELLGGSD